MGTRETSRRSHGPGPEAEETVRIATACLSVLAETARLPEPATIQPAAVEPVHSNQPPPNGVMRLGDYEQLQAEYPSSAKYPQPEPVHIIWRDGPAASREFAQTNNFLPTVLNPRPLSPPPSLAPIREYAPRHISAQAPATGQTPFSNILNAGGVQNSPVVPQAEGATQPSQQLTLHPPGSHTVAVGDVPLQEWDALSKPHPQRARQIVANPTTKGLEKELDRIRDKFKFMIQQHKRHKKGKGLSSCQIKNFRQRYRRQRREAFDDHSVPDKGVSMEDWWFNWRPPRALVANQRNAEIKSLKPLIMFQEGSETDILRKANVQLYSPKPFLQSARPSRRGAPFGASSAATDLPSHYLIAPAPV